MLKWILVIGFWMVGAPLFAEREEAPRDYPNHAGNPDAVNSLMRAMSLLGIRDNTGKEIACRIGLPNPKNYPIADAPASVSGPTTQSDPNSPVTLDTKPPVAKESKPISPKGLASHFEPSDSDLTPVENGDGNEGASPPTGNDKLDAETEGEDPNNDNNNPPEEAEGEPSGDDRINEKEGGEEDRDADLFSNRCSNCHSAGDLDPGKAGNLMADGSMPQGIEKPLPQDEQDAIIAYIEKSQ